MSEIYESREDWPCLLRVNFDIFGAEIMEDLGRRRTLGLPSICLIWCNHYPVY